MQIFFSSCLSMVAQLSLSLAQLSPSLFFSLCGLPDPACRGMQTQRQQPHEQPPDAQDHSTRARDQELMCFSVMLATQPTQAKG
jgi:hypothetical protein